MIKEDDGFTIVKRSRLKKRHFINDVNKHGKFQNGVCNNKAEFDLDAYGIKYGSIYENLMSSEFWQRTRSQLDDVLWRIEPSIISGIDLLLEKCSLSSETISGAPKSLATVSTILTFGLGNFSTQPISLHQLAFMSALLATYLPKSDTETYKRCINYDPCFTRAEREILTNEHSQLVLTGNNECGYDVSEFTDVVVAFMPHCEKEHYENFLATNFKVHALPRVVLISNSLSSICLRTPTRVLTANFPYTYRIARNVAEVPLHNSLYQPHNDVFNDLSIHTFRALPRYDKFDEL